MIVADANLIANLLIPGPFTEAARQVLAKDASWAAPVLRRSELSNVFAGYMRRGLMSLEGALERFAGAADILSGSEYEVNFDEVLRLSSASGCSAYDCQYVLIARALDVPLVTSDRKFWRPSPGSASLRTSSRPTDPHRAGSVRAALKANPSGGMGKKSR